MEDTVKLAVEAEKTFNNCNQLLLTLVDDNILSDQLKNVHKSVTNVKVLQPRFVPQTRYIVEVADIDDVPSVMNTLMEHNFNGRRIQIKLLDHNGYLDLDPYKLEVMNLPTNISNCDLKLLFPLSTGYKLSDAETNASLRTVIVHFENVKDAISSFKTMHLINYKDNVLSIKFVRRNINGNNSLDEEINPHAKKRPNADNFIDERIKSEGNQEVNIPYGQEIEHNVQPNTQITDTLIVHNLPLTMGKKEILTLFPSLCRYKFIHKTASKSCIIRFKTTPEAVVAYTNCENIYMSRNLQVDFYDKEINEIAHRASKISRFHRDKSTNQQQSGKMSPIPNDYISFEHNLKKELEPHSENPEEESLTLRVKNLPSNTTKEDLCQLFPKHCKYQLKVEKTEDCASALIHFLTATAANNACKSMQNKPYRGHVISISFKSKPVKVNPFTTNDASNSTFDSCSSQNDTPALRSTYVLTDLNGDVVAEDDIECKSEDNYCVQDDFDVNSDTINNYESDEEYQGKGLTESILPLDKN